VVHASGRQRASTVPPPKLAHKVMTRPVKNKAQPSQPDGSSAFALMLQPDGEHAKANVSPSESVSLVGSLSLGGLEEDEHAAMMPQTMTDPTPRAIFILSR
jgi:hypothetical protein